MVKNYALSLIAFLCFIFSSYGQTYNQITTIGDLTDGNYLIVGDGSTNVGLMKNTTSSSVIIDYTTIASPGATITTGYTAANVFEITVSGGNITIYNSNEGYASWGRSGATGNDADFYSGTVANTERWTPTVNGSGLWSLANVSNSGRKLRWNTGAPRFAAYTSGQTQLKFYKEDAPAGPTITAAPTTITGLDYFYNIPPSSEDTFTVEGSLLTNDIVITAPTDFEISLTAGTGFTNSITLTESSGTVASTTIYVRLISGKAIGTYTDDVDITSTGASTKTVSVSGDVVDLYCNAGPTNNGDSEIENVTLTGVSLNINNDTTGNCTGATGGVINDFTAQSADVYPGGSYALSVEFGDCNNGGQYDGAGGVWIDWNDDGDFDDTDEEITTVDVAVSGGNVTENITINVPAAQALGDYRMRIVQQEGGTAGAISPCGTFDWGSVEDYTVTVIAATGNLITVTQATGGTISPGSTIVADNANQNFMATPDSCYTFTNWVVDGTNAGSTNTYTFTNVTANHTITAVYTQDTYNITATAGANGTISPTGVTSVSCGNNQTYTITADGGYIVDDVLVDGVSVGDVTSYDFTNVTATHTISVSFLAYLGPCLSDDFDSSYGNWSGGSGTYRNTGAAYTGSGVGFNDTNDDKITSTALTDPSTLNFFARASNSGSTYTISIQYSSTATGPWTTHTTLDADGFNTGDITDTFTAYSIDLNLIGNYYLRIIQSSRTNGSLYLDDVEVFCGTSVPRSELQLVDDSDTDQNCGFTLDLGTTGTNVGTENLTFNIENLGTIDLDVTALTIAGTNAGDFSIVSPATPFSVTPGNSQTVTVQFAPTANGTRTADITIDSNDVDETTCLVNLTGEGITPTPEIDIERNTGASIVNGAAASTGRNTVFAATVMGDTSAPKTFHVSSEGTADITVTSITSSNPSEFAITLNPGASTIAPGNEIDFEISFSPTGVGLRTAVITVRSNDADEDPYTFNVQGNGDCPSGTLTFSPDNGPVGTVVDITSSTANFGGATTATVNGVSATVTVISTSELEITIPVGAASGSIEITDDLGCVSTETFTVIDQLIGNCEGSTGITPTDLFISEITDAGTGSHSYIEIYNGTGTNINLGNYEIRLHNNGNTSATATVPLNTFTLNNNDVYVLAIGGTDATDPEGGYTANQFSGVGGVNEDDNIRLYFDDGVNPEVWVDLWGETTGDPFTVASNDYVYRRKNSGITAPSTTWNTNDWDGFTPIDYSDIGLYDFSIGIPPTVTLEPVNTAFACEFTASFTISGMEGYDAGDDTQELAYQWYYNAPGTATWVEILAGNSDYSGQQSNMLSIANTATLNSYQYYCQLREDAATCFTASQAVKLDVRVSSWDGTNWNTATGIDRYIVIDGDYDTAELTNGETSFEACGCTITAGSELIINDNDYLKVQNNIIVDGTLTVRPYGSFVQVNDAATTTGAVLSDKTKISVVKKTGVLGSINEYVYWSAPVSGEIISDGLQGANPNRIYSYNGQNFLDATKEAANDNATVAGQDDVDDNGDDWIAETGTATMLPGIGYAAAQNSFATYPTQRDYIFQGPFNNGIYNIPIYRNDSETSDNNWNLIGNPYPSAIDADQFLLANASIIGQNVGATNGAIFFWSQATAASATENGNENLNYAQDDYAIINGSGQTAGGDGIMPARAIPSGQAFFISMDNGAAASTVSTDIKTTNVLFNNSMRVTGSNAQFFRSGAADQPNKLWLNLTTDNGVNNQTLVAYVNGATDDYDGSYYDAKKNVATDINAILYSVIENAEVQNLAIQGKNPNSLTLDEVIPLGFVTGIEVPTLYSISIYQLEGTFMTENAVYVNDKLLNTTHNLKDSDYTFTSNTGEFNNRFEIVFNPLALSIDDKIIDSNDLTITELQNGDVEFKVGKTQTITNIEILDAIGRRVYNLKGNNATEVYNLSKLSQAAYIAKVTLSNGQVISKKALKQR